MGRKRASNPARPERRRRGPTPDDAILVDDPTLDDDLDPDDFEDEEGIALSDDDLLPNADDELEDEEDIRPFLPQRRRGYPDFDREDWN